MAERCVKCKGFVKLDEGGHYICKKCNFNSRIDFTSHTIDKMVLTKKKCKCPYCNNILKITVNKVANR